MRLLAGRAYRQQQPAENRRPRKTWVFLLVFFLPVFSSPRSSAADWSPLMERLIADGLEEERVHSLFSRPEIRFDPRVMSGKLETLLKNQSRKSPISPSLPSKGVYRGILNQKVITRARSYLEENRDLLERISARYCVPKEIIVSILLVETRLDEYLGRNAAFNALASMALCTDLETVRPYLPKRLVTPENEEYARTLCRRKADWAYWELQALILYAGYNGFDPLTLPGSIYGAIGLCQFMPTNALMYGVDADNDGRIDLFVKSDALYSIANYLREHGWGCQTDKAGRYRAIYAYNHSAVYVNTILAVAEKLKDKAGKK